nr:ASN_HP1_G0046660.mRNA.1.CDS.1 [Saccharomyces cerevisiae]
MGACDFVENVGQLILFIDWYSFIYQTELGMSNFKTEELSKSNALKVLVHMPPLNVIMVKILKDEKFLKH